MKKAIAKDIGAAKLRVHSTRAAYIRALVAWKKWLLKEVEHLPDSAAIPAHLLKHVRLLERIKKR